MFKKYFCIIFLLSFSLFFLGRAPISKALVFTAVVMTMTTSLLKSKGEFFALSYTKVFSKLGLWRFFTCHLGYSSPPELLFGAALLYCFRTFERQFGSKKYAHCVVGISTLSTVFQTILMLIFPKLNFAPGPYAVMFGMFAYYFMDIPSVTRFRVCGIPMNDKIFLYLLGIQVYICCRCLIYYCASCYRSIPSCSA